MRGAVIAADNGSPIRRAQVRISGQGVPSRLATTDAQGRFEIKELPAGRYTLSALKAGFVTLQYGQRRPSESGTPIDLGDGQILDKLVIGLPRGSVITGRITDEFGEPVANAVVTALRYGYTAGAKRLMPGGGQNSRGTTDDQGQFRLFGLSPGDYIVSAALRAGGEVTDPAGEATGYPPTYYPGTANVAEAQRVSVAIGQEQNSVTFGLIATRLVRVTGAVIDSQGGPVRNGMVMLAPSGTRLGAGAMMQMTTARVSDSGQFRLTNVAPGRYVAQVRTTRGGGGRGGPGDGSGEVGRQEIAVGAEDLDGVVIVTGPGARVTGVVAIDGQSSIRAQQVQVGARLAEPDQAMPGAGGGMARLNDDWTFEMNGLFDARLFRVGVPQGWTLKSVTLNGQDITDTPIELPPGQTVTGLQIDDHRQGVEPLGTRHRCARQRGHRRHRGGVPVGRGAVDVSVALRQDRAARAGRSVSDERPAAARPLPRRRRSGTRGRSGRRPGISRAHSRSRDRFLVDRWRDTRVDSLPAALIHAARASSVRSARRRQPVQA